MMKLKKKFDLSIIIPVYNEKKNLKKLINQIEKNTKNFNKEILIVDDNSDDGSHEEIKKIRNKSLKFLIRRSKIRDLSKSCIYGFNLSRSNNILVMDGDLQHDPKYIGKIYKKYINKDLDILVASRDFKKAEFSLIRKLISMTLNKFINFFLNQKVSDPLSGFFIFRKKIFLKNKKKLYGYGYKILIDLIYNAQDKIKIDEMLIVFNKRFEEKSKLNIKVLIHLIKFVFLKKVT